MRPQPDLSFSVTPGTTLRIRVRALVETVLLDEKHVRHIAERREPELVAPLELRPQRVEEHLRSLRERPREVSLQGLRHVPTAAGELECLEAGEAITGECVSIEAAPGGSQLQCDRTNDRWISSSGCVEPTQRRFRGSPPSSA